MAAAKKSTSKELAVDEKTQALLHAIATGDTSAVDPAALQEALGKLGLKAVAKGVQGEKYSRIEKRRQWLTANGLSEDEKQVVKEFSEVVGTSPRILSEDDARSFTQGEIDSLMKEELARRQLEDITKGDYDSIRATILNLATFQDPTNDPFATGTFTSPANGHKFTVTKQERGGAPDFSKLEDIVSSKTWEAITDEVTVRQVNEEKLTKALSDATVSIEDFAALVPDKTTIRVLRVDPLKDGDVL